MVLKIVLESSDDSGFIAHVPALKGCRSQGQTREQALDNIREAIAAWLEVEQDKFEPVGNASQVELVNI